MLHRRTNFSLTAFSTVSHLSLGLAMKKKTWNSDGFYFDTKQHWHRIYPMMDETTLGDTRGKGEISNRCTEIDRNTSSGLKS